MRRIHHVWVLWLAALALAAGCARAGTATPTAAPGSTAAPQATEGVGIDDGRGATALEAYPPALEQAKECQFLAGRSVGDTRGGRDGGALGGNSGDQCGCTQRKSDDGRKKRPGAQFLMHYSPTAGALDRR